MHRSVLSTVLLAGSLAHTVQAQAGVYSLPGSTTTLVYTVTQNTNASVLATKYFQYPYLPYKADTNNGDRGPQVGYNLCNSTTLGSGSLCQTAWLNSLDDFCLWGAQNPNSVVGDVEGDMVAYCTKPDHGTRVIPPGALTGVQFVRAPGYVQVVGYIDQTTLNLQANDAGGEEDPHGADNRGNPLGGLVFSSAFAGNASVNSTAAIKQVTQWNMFIGNGIFCFKACTPGNGTAYNLCDNVYDEIGCNYNMPANYNTIPNFFQSCLSDDQDRVGVYTSNGQVMTWYQSQNGGTPPYSVRVPPSSSCTLFSSSSLYSPAASYYSGSGTITSSASRATRTPAPTM